jgi:hypothetical protein
MMKSLYRFLDRLFYRKLTVHPRGRGFRLRYRWNRRCWRISDWFHRRHCWLCANPGKDPGSEE